MPVLRYTAVNQTGKTVSGQIEIDRPADLEARLLRQGLSLVSYSKVSRRKGGGAGGGLFAPKVNEDELAQFCFFLERLVAGGVPLLEGLADVRDSVTNPTLRSLVGTVIENIEQGKTLSQALKDHPKYFDVIFTSLVEAGEESGELDTVLRSLSENIRWQADIIKRTKKVFRYPIAALFVVSGAAYGLLVMVVPPLTEVLTSLGQELPIQTVLLIQTSEFVQANFIYIFGVIGGLFGLFIFSKRAVPGVDYLVDKFKVRMPIFGSVLEKLVFSRFANVFGILYASGISVIDGLKIAKGAMGNKFLARGMDTVIADIVSGTSLYNAFKKSGLFPPLVLRMVKLGESTGGLDSAMLEVKSYYDKDANEAIENAQAAVGPLMMVLIAGLLVWVILAIYGPLYDIVGNINQ